MGSVYLRFRGESGATQVFWEICSHFKIIYKTQCSCLNEMSECVRDRDRRKGGIERGVEVGVHAHMYPFFWRDYPYLFQRILKTIYNLQNIKFSQQGEEVGLGTGTHALRYRKP